MLSIPAVTYFGLPEKLYISLLFLIVLDFNKKNISLTGRLKFNLILSLLRIDDL